MTEEYRIPDDEREKLAITLAKKNIPLSEESLAFSCAKYNLLSITVRDVELAKLLLASDVYNYLTSKIETLTAASTETQVESMDTIFRLKKRRSSLVAEIKKKTGYTDVYLFSY